MEFQLEHEFDTDASNLYHAWLDSTTHCDMTGGEASITPLEGAEFSAWDRYISGKNIKLIQNRYIQQRWRTAEFEENQPDSILELHFENTGQSRCKLTLIHSGLEEKDTAYIQGWKDFYFTPMDGYFQNPS